MLLLQIVKKKLHLYVIFVKNVTVILHFPESGKKAAKVELN